MNRRLLFIIPLGVFAGLAILLLTGLFEGPPSELPSPLVGLPAPDFKMSALDSRATAFTRDELGKGKPIIVNFFASWCAPCKIEAPVLREFATRKGIILYGVVYKDAAEKARAFLDESGNPFAKIDNDPTGRVGIDWGVTGVPETFVIDAKGIIRARYAGPLSDDIIRDVILPAMGS